MLTLYYGSGSPYAWRVNLALEHKALPYERKVLSFAQGDLKKPEYLALNPRGKVPVLVDGDFVLYESSAIMEYLDEAYPAQGQRLYPGDPQRRALQRRVILETNDYFEKAADPLWTQAFGRKPEERDLAVVAAGRVAARAELDRIASGFAGDYFGGSAPGAADFCVYTMLGFVRRCELKVPEVAFADLIGPQYGAWMARIEALPYSDACIPPTWKAAA
jgi:glutathione S-transferase